MAFFLFLLLFADWRRKKVFSTLRSLSLALIYVIIPQQARAIVVIENETAIRVRSNFHLNGFCTGFIVYRSLYQKTF